jgi:hypothetical protein
MQIGEEACLRVYDMHISQMYRLHYRAWWRSALLAASKIELKHARPQARAYVFETRDEQILDGWQ